MEANSIKVKSLYRHFLIYKLRLYGEDADWKDNLFHYRNKVRDLYHADFLIEYQTGEQQ